MQLESNPAVAVPADSQPSHPPLRITSVEYRRLRTFGSYQNETVGAIAEVARGQSPDEALAELRAWVDQQLGDDAERRELSERVNELRWKADEHERRIARANAQWTAIIGFLDKLGIERPSDIPESLAELPY